MKKIILLVFVVIVFMSCSNNEVKKENTVSNDNPKVKIDTSNQGYEMLSDTVISTLSLDMVPDKPPIFKHFDKKEFLDSLIFSVTKGRIKAYDFFDFTPLSIDEVKENLGMVRDTIMVENPETGDTTVKVTNGNFEISNVREVVFIEKWYWDKSNNSLHKKIIAYGPVIYVVKDDSTAGYPVLKRVPFVIMNK